MSTVLDAAYSQAMEANPAAAKGAIADAQRALLRIVKRSATLPAEYERVEVVRQRGPTLEFSGRLLASHEFTTRSDDPMRVEFEVWETVAGAYVAVTTTTPAEREGVELSSATVVEPQDDAQAMRFAVMEHFDWHDRARAMARKQLGWSLRAEVE
jgi:hypothetical protein